MSEHVTIKKGTVISKFGDFEMEMYRIEKGIVSVYANYGEEDQMLLKEQVAGDYFGHLELIEAVPRTATTVAKEDCVLEKISGDEFGTYFTEHAEEHLQILLQMSARLRELGTQLEEVYDTIDKYLSNEGIVEEDEGIFARLSRIITFGRSHKKTEEAKA